MRLLISVSLLLLIIFGCKDQNMDSASAPIQSLEGSWKKVETYTGLTNSPQWTNVPDSLQVMIRFRADGVLIDKNGVPDCCRPISYIINSTLVDVNKNVEVNPTCATIYCVGCQVWEIQLSSAEMIISGCASANGKYRRL